MLKQLRHSPAVCKVCWAQLCARKALAVAGRTRPGGESHSYLRPGSYQERLQRAPFALCNLPAMVLAHLHNQSVQGVVVVCQLSFRCKGGERRLYPGPQFLVPGSGGRDSVPLEQALGVVVHHKNGEFAGIEEDGIGSFWTDAMQSEELGA